MGRVGVTARSAVDRTACINIRALPLQLLLRRHPEWRKRPVAVVEQEKPQSPILGTNPAAARAGIGTGNALCLRSLAGPKPVCGDRPGAGNSGRGPAGPRAAGPVQPPDRALSGRARDFLGRRRRTRPALRFSPRLGRADRLPPLPNGAVGQCGGRLQPFWQLCHRQGQAPGDRASLSRGGGGPQPPGAAEASAAGAQAAGTTAETGPSHRGRLAGSSPGQHRTASGPAGLEPLPFGGR